MTLALRITKTIMAMKMRTKIMSTKLIPALEWALSTFKCNLGAHNCRRKCNLVLSQTMTPALRKAAKLFQPSIHCLVAGSGPFLGTLVRTRNKVIRHSNLVITVAFVCLHQLIWVQTKHQTLLENLDIWVPPARERPIGPYNIPRLNVDGDFVSKTWTLVLV
jgi:hypothetical protein